MNYISILFLLCFGSYSVVANAFLEESLDIFSHIKTNTISTIQKLAAEEVIKRILPLDYQFFEIDIDQDQLPINTFRIEKNDTSPIVWIVASSGVSACKGFYYYFKYYCNGHVSWDGVHLPNINYNDLPTISVEKTSATRFTYYQNVCTWSYSFTWWKWSDWQKHIDWMALQGVTLTLAPNQELIWEQIYLELGLTSTEIDDHLSGAGFFAWQRMGNIRGWGGPLTKQFKQHSNELQRKIIRALSDLGIVTALPAFAGHVPIAFKRLYPNVTTMSYAERWNRFSNQYCCPLFIDPIDPLFGKIGEMFLKHMIHEYYNSSSMQTSHIYFSDPFNEIQPRLSNAEYLHAVSKGIYQTMKNVDENAIWLLQGWMFVKNPFWSQDLLEAFLTGVPIGKLLVLDLQSEIYPQYVRTHSFYGQPFIWNMLHNFGGTLGMHGSFENINQEIERAKKITNSTLSGVGITPEGINQNYVLYEFVLERGWSSTPFDIEHWLMHYVRVRYGKENQLISRAWNTFRTTVYNYNGTEKISGKYIVCKRPSLKLTPMMWYNYTEFQEAWTDLLLASDEFIDSPLYKRDLVDVTRQFIQNKIDEFYVLIIDAYNKRNLTHFNEYSTNFLNIMYDMDELLGSHEHFLLGKWIESAKEMGGSTVEQQLFMLNAKYQITTWGPNGEIIDYAMKQWSGMIKDYCMARWQYFFDELRKTFEDHQQQQQQHDSTYKFNENVFKKNVFKKIEEPFVTSNKVYPVYTNGNSIDIAKNIHLKWVK